MTAAEEFVRAVGSRVAHCTAAVNLPGINAFGLRSAADLAGLSGGRSEDIVLRNDRRKLEFRGHWAQLNHQLPIRRYHAAATRVLQGHTPESWAAQLDKRIFFYPENQADAFAASIGRDVEVETLWLDSRRLYDHFHHALELSPINTGNFAQGGGTTVRGDWIYVRADLGRVGFRENRLARGLISRPDTRVREISLRVAIPAEDLQSLRVTP